MRLQQITAKADPLGNGITLSWTNPEVAQFPGVRIMRRTETYPIAPDDGALVLEGEGLDMALDENLHAETVYYYAFFPYQNDPPDYVIDRHNRVSAMATGPNNMAGQIYDLLPAIYHRYDTVLPRTIPEGMSEVDKTRGALRRFLDLPGGQLDQFVSFAKSGLDLSNREKVDGALLPLLAQWIGWQTDYRLELDAQRNEIRDAVSVYQTIGLIPSVEATVKRMLGWESRAKEFVHNVAQSNQPEGLNLWVTRRNGLGGWAMPSDPLSLGFSYEGRPTAVYDETGTLWLFFHTLRNGHWDIWTKTLTIVSIPVNFQETLDRDVISFEIQTAFIDAGYALSLSAKVEKNENEWVIKDTENHEVYSVLEAGSNLDVYRWSPSERLTHGQEIDKHPTAVLLGDQLWVFWDRFDERGQHWQVQYQIRQGGVWSAVETFGDETRERRQPQTLVDHTGSIWLFWLEKTGRRWALKYKRREASSWHLASAHTFPLDGGENPKVDTDFFVLFQPPETTSDTMPRLWVFWSRKVPTGVPKQTRWEIAYRIAINIDPNAFTWIHSWSTEFPNHTSVDFDVDPMTFSYLTWYVNRPPDWSFVHTVPKASPMHDDREPAAFINADGLIELFWSSNRDQGWSIWSGQIITAAIPNLVNLAPVTEIPHSQRAPLPILIDGRTWLLYSTNRPLHYLSDVYTATETVDSRYSGSTTVHASNLAKTALRGKFDDFQTYSYDTGKKGLPDDGTWYARNTIGIYLTPDTEDPDIISRNRTLIENILKDFLPIPVRAVFIIEPVTYKEWVYTYGFPMASPQRLVGELSYDGTIPELISGVEDILVEVQEGE